MATAYSNEVSVGTYNRIRLRVEYSGTSADCHIEFRRTSAYTGTWGDTDAQITLNGITQSAPYWYSGTVDSSWRTIADASGFTVPISGGTLSWNFNNPGGSSVLGCSGTIDIPAQTVAPSGGFLSSVVPGTDSFTITGGISSFGTPASGTVRMGVAQRDFQQAGVAQYAASFNTLSSTVTINNSSTRINNPQFTIGPNNTYYIGLYAQNSGSAEYRYTGGQYTTIPLAPTVALDSVTDTTATFSYSTVADGGALTKTIEYSLDGTTWYTGTTVSTGSASSGTFTITGLTAGTTYNVQTRVTTSAGSTAGPTVIVTTSAPVATCALYGSLNGQTKKVKKLYGSLNGQTKLIKKLYGSVNGVTKLVYEA